MSKTTHILFGILTSILLAGSINAKAQSTTTAEAAINEVYGTYQSQLNAEQTAWLHNQLERSELRKVDRKEKEDFPLLSSVAIQDKYVGGLKKDAFTGPLKINPLKYQINFMNKRDQMFRIDGTDYVLFVKGKK